MNRVVKRTWLMGLFIAMLVVGILFFAWEYASGASGWIGSAGSPYVHNNAIGYGTVTDRSGALLLDIGTAKTYSTDPATRASTMHWLGDRQGNIASRTISHYSGEMSGYDIVNGVYDFSGLGGSMELTISARVQNAALEAMAGRKGTVAVYNYKTGEILCAVTTPTYDPDQVPDLTGENGALYEGVYLNRFVQSRYIPGSIFKTVTTAAALDCVPGIEDMTFTCTGILEYGEEKVSCEHPHGTQTIGMALSHSCNCAFAQIAELVGRKNMNAYIAAYGITEPVSFDGITTASGNYDISQAAPVSFAWSCIGQYTDLINPCRFMTFMGAVGGGGQAAEPYIVSSVSGGGQTTYTAKTTTTGKLMSPAVADTLTGYMRDSVKAVYGADNFPGLTVCAKSGTSQLGGGLTSNAMFAGFVADDAYPLAFIVVVENGGYGSATCVPILRTVLAECKAVLDGE